MLQKIRLEQIEYVKNKNDKTINCARWDNTIWNYFR